MLQEKLLDFKKKINESEEMDDEFDCLVGVKLFDLIKANEVLKKEFDNRTFYFENLAESLAVEKIEDEIVTTIKKILDLMRAKEIKETHPIPINYSGLLKVPDPDELTGPELYKIFTDKNTYYRLKDFKKDLCSYSPFSWEKSSIRQQYKLVEIILDSISKTWTANDKRLEKYKKLVGELNQSLGELDELFCRKSIKLNVGSFKDLFHHFATKNLIKGYTDAYGGYIVDFDGELIKKLCNTVIDDLIEAIPDNKPPVENEKIKNQTGKTLITRDKATGDFYYKDKLVNFQNKKAIYFLIFECLYENCDYEGFCSYEDIDRYLVKKNMGECADERKVKDRIKNGITNLFRFSSLPSKIPTGKNLIDKARGKGLVINNPVV